MSDRGIVGFFLMDTGLFALICIFLVTLTPLFIDEPQEDILNDTYEINEANQEFAFLIGEANIFRDKERFGSCPNPVNVSHNFRFLYELPIDYEYLFELGGDLLLETTDEDVSTGNLITVMDGNIDATRLSEELTVQGIVKAGNETGYDFYAGTYDSGYIVGGEIDDEGFDYDILFEMDERIRELEVADVTGDGNNEVLAATHYDGITTVFYPDEDWDREVISEKRYGENSTFNHEVLASDITGDGVKDIVSTPSEPNTWEEEQKGVIKLHTYDDGDWKVYESDELDRSHIRKVVLNNEDNSIIGGVGQRTEPYHRTGSYVKYEFVNDSLEMVDEIESVESMRNLYPFLVEREDENLVVGLSSNSYAHVISAGDFETLSTESFSDSFEAFYTADAFDYTGDGNQELAIVQDGDIVIYVVNEDGLREIDRVNVYEEFESIVWSLRALET